MSEINNVLNDESKNDKELIKELSVYVKNHRDKNLSIDKNFFKDIIDIILKNSEINFENIEFIDYKSAIANWSSSYMSLRFNVTAIINNARTLKYYKLNSNVGDNRIFAYYYVLEVIIHELTHARQDYVRRNENNEIYGSCRQLINEKYGVYRQHHDEVLIERYAHLRGYTLAYEVLTYIYPEKQIKELRAIIYTYLLYGYKINHNGYIVPAGYDYVSYEKSEIISAFDSYNEIMEANSLSKISIDSYETMSLYDRFYLGLPISMLEYHKLILLYCDICHNDEKTQKVKTLINKL